MEHAQMTPVQAATIPLMQHKDVAAEAFTGSGETDTEETEAGFKLNWCAHYQPRY